MNTTPSTPQAPIDVSIVVCTFNRATELPRAVESLMRQSTEGQHRFEIVIVDNASMDDTAAVIGRLAAKSPVPLRGVFEPKPGVAAARNRGIQTARGTWIAFFDDDQLAAADWLSELWATTRRRDALCVGGAVRLKLPEGTTRAYAPICRALWGETLEPHERAYDRKFAPGAGNLMVHRAIFEQVGTFDETLQQGGEDTELFRRIRQAGFASWYTPLATVEHLIPVSRLKPAHLKWSSTRVGGHIADRERSEFGPILFPLVAAARLVLGLGQLLRDEVSARLRRDPEALLGGRCRWWRTCGYLRQAMRRTFPTCFRQTSFFAKLEFRGERGKASISLGPDVEVPSKVKGPREGLPVEKLTSGSSGG